MARTPRTLAVASTVSAAVVGVALVAGCGSDAGRSSAPELSSSAPSSTTSSSAAVSSTGTAAAPSPSSSGSSSGSPASSERTALFFGDSNFVGGGCTPDPTQDMAQIAADRLGYTAVIRGAGGTGFVTGNPQYGLADLVTQVDQGALDLSPAPQLVVVEGGSNDTGQSIDAITVGAETVLRAATSTYPDALVVLMAPIDVRAGQGDVTPSIVGALEYAAGQVGVPFLNAYDWLPWRTTAGLVCSDFDHASPAGQQILGTTLAAALAAAGA